MLVPHLTTMDLILISITLAFSVYLFTEQKKLRKLLPFNTCRKKTKILSVVAGENLDMTEIEKSLYSTDITYNLLNYNSVTQDSLLSELEKDITVFELSSHGLNGGFMLGNATLPSTWLASSLNLYKSLECVLLLYCNSYIDQEIIAGSRLFVVSLIGDVEDKSCITFARQFYYFLNKQFTYKEAVERAKLHLPVEDFAKFLFIDKR
jgi:hypothetical protein